MKSLNILFIFTCILIFVNTSGCKKYDDNSGIHFKSKKGRLKGKWRLSTLLFDGIDVGATSRTWEISSDGSVSMFAPGSTTKGKWVFSESKSALFITWEPADHTYKYYIQKLTNKELWLESGEGYLYKYNKE